MKTKKMKNTKAFKQVEVDEVKGFYGGGFLTDWATGDCGGPGGACQEGGGGRGPFHDH